MAGPSIMVRVLGDVSGLGQSFDDAGTKSESAASRIKSAFGGVMNALNQTGILGPFQGAINGVQQGLDAIGQKGASAGEKLMGLGAVGVGVGVGLQAAASKDVEAHAQLQAAIEANGQSYAQYGDQIEATVKHQENFGNSAADTQSALTELVQQTHSTSEATQEMGLVADLAAAKHISLQDAATMVGRAYDGNTRLFKQYGITVEGTGKSTQLNQEALDQLSARLSGQASAAVSGFTGHMDVLKTKIEDQVAVIGQKYGPAITAASAVMTGLGATMTTARAAADLFKSTEEEASAVTKVWTGIQAAFDAVMDANPVVLVVLAVAALVAAVILAYTHVKVFRDAVDDMGKVVAAVFGAIFDGARVVYDWIAQNWPLLLAILAGPFALLIFELVKHWDDVEAFLRGLPQDISNIAAGMWHGITDAFLDAVNAVIDVWNRLHFTLPKVDVLGVHIGGESIGVPQIPHLAQGGIVTQSGLIYAHAGEAVTPAPGNRTGGPGPLVAIHHSTFNSATDVDMIAKKLEFALRANLRIA
jgi:hypothetical protein